jgi:hypothetical protein
MILTMQVAYCKMTETKHISKNSNNNHPITYRNKKYIINKNAMKYNIF